MTLDDFLKQVYHTQYYVVIPALGRAKIEKKDFFNKGGRLDSKKLNAHLCKVYELNFNKQEKKNEE
jgi:hypothetical protein